MPTPCCQPPRRPVACVLSDFAYRGGSVCVIATSARPDQLPAAFPQLCDRGLSLPLADAAARKSLLGLLNPVPTEETSNLDNRLPHRVSSVSRPGCAGSARRRCGQRLEPVPAADATDAAPDSLLSVRPSFTAAVPLGQRRSHRGDT